MGRIVWIGCWLLTWSASSASLGKPTHVIDSAQDEHSVLVFQHPPGRVEFIITSGDSEIRPDPPGQRGLRGWLWFPQLTEESQTTITNNTSNQSNQLKNTTSFLSMEVPPVLFSWVQSMGQANVQWSTWTYDEKKSAMEDLSLHFPMGHDSAWYHDGLLQLASMYYALDEYAAVLSLLERPDHPKSWQTEQLWHNLWLQAESNLNLGRFPEAVGLFGQLTGALESANDLSQAWQMNRIEIKSSGFIARSLFAFYIQQSTLPAVDELLPDLEQAIGLDDAVLISDVLYAQAINQVMRRNLSESIALLDLAIELRTEASQTEGLHLFYHQKAVTWFMFNHLDDALLNYRQALGLVSQQEFPLYWAGLHVSMAKIYRQLGEYSTAGRYANRAEQFYQDQALFNELAITHQLKGRIAEGAGRAAQAITHHQQALAFFTQHNRKLAIKSLLEIGRNQLKQGDQSEARSHLITAWVSQLHFLDPESFRAVKGLPPMSDDVSETRAAVSQLEETEPLLAELLSLGQHQDVVVASAMLSLYELTSAPELLSALRAVTELENGQVDWPVELQLAVFALLIEDPQAKLAEAHVDDLADRALEQINHTREQFAGTDTALYWNDKAQGFIDTYVTHLLSRGDARAAFALLEEQQLRGIELSAQQGTEHQQYEQHKQQLTRYLAAVKASVIDGGSIDTVSLDEQRELLTRDVQQLGEAGKPVAQSSSVNDLSALQQSLSGQQLVLKYVISPKQSQLFIITKEQWLSQPLPEQAVIRDLSQAFLSAIQSRDPAWQEQARALSAALRLNASLLEGRRELIVLADDVLTSVPFAALSAMDADEYRPLVMDRTITYTRSLQHYLRNQEPGVDPYQTATVVSNPVFVRELMRADQSASTTRQAGDPTENLLTRFMKLPQTEREASLLMRHMTGLTVHWLNREAASTQRILSEPSRNSDILHLATHGYFADTSMDHVGLATSVSLADGQVSGGFLSLREIFAHRFYSRLVVISGCETIQGKLFDGEGLVGLTHGLLKQGADAVLATIWAIPDRITPDFMDHFYFKLLRQGADPATALSQAQRHFLQSFNNGQYRHPYYWAGFVLAAN